MLKVISLWCLQELMTALEWSLMLVMGRELRGSLRWERLWCRKLGKKGISLWKLTTVPQEIATYFPFYEKCHLRWSPTSVPNFPFSSFQQSWSLSFTFLSSSRACSTWRVGESSLWRCLVLISRWRYCDCSFVFMATYFWHIIMCRYIYRYSITFQEMNEL